jgi:hypothetical protein
LFLFYINHGGIEGGTEGEKMISGMNGIYETDESGINGKLRMENLEI